MLVVAVQLVAFLVVDASFVERRIRAASGDHVVSVGDASVNLIAGRVRLENVHVGTTDRATTAGGRPFSVEVAEMQLTGVRLWRLLLKEGVAFNRLSLRAPRVLIEREADSIAQADSTAQVDGTAQTNSTAQADSSRKSIHEMLAAGLPRIRLASIEVRDGALSWINADGDTTTVSGISVDVVDVDVDSARAHHDDHLLFADDIQLRLAPHVYSAGTDSLYALHVGAVTASSKLQSIVLDTLRYAPRVDDETFMSRQANQTNRLVSAIGFSRIAGFDFRRLVDEQYLYARRVVVDSAFVDVFSDKRLPERPVRPATMPHELLQRLPVRIRVDTIYVTRADVFYSEIRPDAVDRGSVSFEKTRAVVTDIRTDGTDVEKPATLDVRTQLFGAPELHTQIRYWLQEPTLRITYTGTLDETDIEVANGVFFNLIGLRTTSGHVDNLWFDVEARGRLATGELRVLYNDLALEIRDMSGGRTTLVHRLATFIADDVKLKRSNPSDDGAARVAVIRHERAPDDRIIRFLWHSLRQGMLDTAGL